MVYRILLIGGPEDGNNLIAQHPWFECWPNNFLYQAEMNGDQPIIEDGDKSTDGSHIEGVSVDTGDWFSPPVQTIKMYWTGKTKYSAEEWDKQMMEFNQMFGEDDEAESL